MAFGLLEKDALIFYIGVFLSDILRWPPNPLLGHRLRSEVEVLRYLHLPPSHRPFGLCISSVMRRVPLTPFSTLTRKGFMYNSYILALTCVMSDLD